MARIVVHAELEREPRQSLGFPGLAILPPFKVRMQPVGQIVFFAAVCSIRQANEAAGAVLGKARSFGFDHPVSPYLIFPKNSDYSGMYPDIWPQSVGRTAQPRSTC
jgi:hypothetical protein